MTLTFAERIRYYKSKQKRKPIVEEHIREVDGIVHGARALNAFFPPHLDAHTRDYDVFDDKPKTAARQLERRLDKKFGGDYFRVEKAQHEGTWKVKSNVTNKTTADFTEPDKEIPNKKINGIRYATLAYHKKKIKETLADPEKEFRHEKDKEALQRIKLFEKEKNRYRRKARKDKRSFLAMLPKIEKIKVRY